MFNPEKIKFGKLENKVYRYLYKQSDISKAI